MTNAYTSNSKYNTHKKCGHTYIVYNFKNYIYYINFRNIIKLENNIFKKQKKLEIEVPDNKLITPIEINNHEHDFKTKNLISSSSLGNWSSQSTENCEQSKLLESSNQNSSQSQDEKIVNYTLNSKNKEDSNQFKTESNKSKHKPNIKTVVNETQSGVNDTVNQKISNGLLLRPPPKIVNQLSTFLSEDLIKKTLEVFIYKYFNYINS